MIFTTKVTKGFHKDHREAGPPGGHSDSRRLLLRNFYKESSGTWLIILGRKEFPPGV